MSVLCNEGVCRSSERSMRNKVAAFNGTNVLDTLDEPTDVKAP